MDPVRASLEGSWGVQIHCTCGILHPKGCGLHWMMVKRGVSWAPALPRLTPFWAAQIWVNCPPGLLWQQGLPCHLQTRRQNTSSSQLLLVWDVLLSFHIGLNILLSMTLKNIHSNVHTASLFPSLSSKSATSQPLWESVIRGGLDSAWTSYKSWFLNFHENVWVSF